MSSLFSFFSPAVAFGLGMIAQALYKLIPLFDAKGWKKFGGSIFGSFALTIGGVLEAEGKITLEEIVLMFCLIFSGVLFFSFRRHILPKINELVILCWNVGVWYILLKNLGLYNPLSIVLLVPTLLSLSVVFLSVKLNRFSQLALYFWFIVMSFIVTLTYFPWSMVRIGIKTHHFSSLETFFLGMGMYYAFSYLLCIVAFIPIPSKHSKPGDELKRIKEHGDDVESSYDEIQFHPVISLFVAAIIIATLAINYVSPFVSEVILLGILFGVSPLFGEKFHYLIQKIK